MATAIESLSDEELGILANRSSNSSADITKLSDEELAQLANKRTAAQPLEKGETGGIRQFLSSGPVSLGIGASGRDLPAIGFRTAEGLSQGTARSILERPRLAAVSGIPGAAFSANANVIPDIVNLSFPGSVKRPFPEEVDNLTSLEPKAVTERGEALATGGEFIGGVAGPAAVASLLKGKGLSNVIKQAQNEFFSFQGSGTRQFGGAIREARKLHGTLKVSPKEVEAAFSPIVGATKEVTRQLSKLVRESAKSVKNIGVEGLLKKKAILRRSMSVAERTGRLVTDRSKTVGKVIDNIDEIIRSRVPGIEKANADYALFSRVKSFIEKLEPRFAKLPDPFGTSEGEKLLRNVFNFTKEEVAAFQFFEHATDLKILGKARSVEAVRRIKSVAVKVLGIAAAFRLLGNKSNPAEFIS